eukprot:gnl/TRDRNA2_/TRDRNA2_161547_c0_seq3.p2 gnl/TRDRNA2_/TRDRNA2_161547_c0~~gnl/TRDRNA2_/TRDRNA2_161547_c0_seq3.p2  ORF type:complete len:188 (-),score=21.63 gnl/TRDRNA2_/TRDRNA2_161547_c0_seq3:3-566(-)
MPNNDNTASWSPKETQTIRGLTSSLSSPCTLSPPGMVSSVRHAGHCRVIFTAMDRQLAWNLWLHLVVATSPPIQPGGVRAAAIPAEANPRHRLATDSPGAMLREMAVCTVAAIEPPSWQFKCCRQMGQTSTNASFSVVKSLPAELPPDCGTKEPCECGYFISFIPLIQDGNLTGDIFVINTLEEFKT